MNSPFLVGSSFSENRPKNSPKNHINNNFLPHILEHKETSLCSDMLQIEPHTDWFCLPSVILSRDILKYIQIGELVLWQQVIIRWLSGYRKQILHRL